jgi:ABC-type antimicrobial peptide transport system permease subunit
VETLQDLDQPFPMDLDRVTDRDDEYWKLYRAVPKAYVSLEKARKLWQSRYGKQTSIQIEIPAGMKGEEFASRVKTDFLKHVDLQGAGFIVQPLRRIGLEAAQGSNDFSGLFLGFSLFLILGALLLVAMLYRLNIEQRAQQVGLMQALGLTPNQILYLFGGEGLVTVILGAIAGTVTAIIYAYFMLYALTTWWRGAVGTTDLGVYLSYTTLVMGFMISTVLSFIVILLSLRGLNKFSARELMQGDWREAEGTSKPSWFYRQRYVIMVFSFVLIGSSLAGIVPRSEAVAGLPWTVFSFFISGMGLLTSGILISQDLLESGLLNILKHRGLLGVVAIAMRNSTRQMSRSLVSIALVSIATYLVIAVALGKYNPTRLEPELKSGNGGFRLVAESTQAIIPDWGIKQGQLDLGITLNEAEQKLISGSKTFRLLKKVGEDASCLNLYQTRLPTILGVNKSFIERGGFAFAETPGKNPWEVLLVELPDQQVPVLGDMNTLQFSLHKGPGTTIELTNSTQPQTQAKIMGMLTGSLFQGVLLMSEENFRRLYPEVTGASYFLVETTQGDQAGLTSLLETKLADYGLDMQGVAELQREFLFVQNTYLSTFQSLGGFGLLLGTIGVAIVMLRNVLERKKEYALMQSLGFLPSYLSSLILCENGIIVGYGLSIGTASAVISMWPHLSQSGADVPWRDVILLLGLIFSTGILSGLYAAKVASEGSIVETLRN